jgi:large subunit ribosomal protein L5
MENIKKQQNLAVKELTDEFNYSSPMAAPRLTKVTINVGIGEKIKGMATDKAKQTVDYVVNEIALITGQKPVVTKAKKSISGFDIREGDPVGVKVTLRDERMFNFLEKLINVVLPGLRDFRGLDSSKIDQAGNFTLGVEEHISFPEIPADERDDILSLQLTVTNTAKTKEEGLKLLTKIGFPFKK